MIKYITILLLFVSFAAKAQYTPNSGAYQWKGGKFTNSLQPPSTAANPVTATNAPDSNSAALYYNETDTTWYQFNPISKVWSPFGGGVNLKDSIFISSIDSIFITDTDSIFIISGNDTIYIGDADQIRDTAYLTNGYGIQMINVTSPEDSFYKPNGYDINIRLDTSVLGDYIVQVINNDTTIINNNDSVPAIIVDTLSNSPPVGATSGYKVLIGTSPTGAFAGHANDIAELVGAVWNFTDPVCEMQVIVDNSVTYATYQYKCNIPAWVQTSVLWRVGGNRGVGTNAFIGRPDKQRFVIRAWNKVVAIFDTTRDVLLPKYAGLQNEPLYFKPGTNGRIDTGRFKIPIYESPVIQDSVLYIDDGVFKYGTATGGSGSQTWQQTLDVGSTLDKDNTVDAGGNYFYMHNLEFLQFASDDPATPDWQGLFSVNPNGVAMAGSKIGFNSQVAASNDSAVIEGINIDGSDLWETYMSMTDEYARFDRKSVSGSPTFSPYPKIYYAPEIMEGEPDYIYGSHNDTIKKYLFSGGGGAAVNVYAPLAKSNDSLSLRFTVKQSGDGIYDTTGAITSSDATLTTVNSIFASGDVGKVIVVIGAGTSGRDLVTTIASFTSATSVELTANAATTVSSNAKFVFGTDRTAAIQATINACYAAGGGVVHIPNGIYVIAGALQTSVGGINMNSQIYIPAPSASISLSLTHIEIEGETPANYTQYGVLNANNNNTYNGTVLVSTLATGATGAAVIGTRGVTGDFGSFNYNYLTVKNLAIKVLDNPSGAGPVIGGISYKYGASLIADQISVTNIGAGQASILPANDVAGIETPDYSSESMSHLTNINVSGFKYGFKIGEHTVLDQAQAAVCYYGFGIKQGFHNIHGGRLGAYWCTNDIYHIPGSIAPSLKIDAFDDEFMSAAQSGGKWYDNIYTINDSLNQIRGSMFFTLIGAYGIGRTNTHLAKNGGANFSTYAIGDSSSFAKVNGNNIFYNPSGNLNQILNANLNAENGIKWQREGTDFYKLVTNIAGDGKFDLQLYNYKTSSAKLYFDSTGIVNIGGIASINSSSGLSISNSGDVYAPNNIGIGVASPTRRLEISGSTNPLVHITNTNASSYASINLVNSGGAAGQVWKAGGSASAYKNTGAGDLAFYTSSNNISFLNDDAGGNINFAPGGASTARVTFNSNGTVTMAQYGAGTATFDASGNISSVSDERVKRNIHPFKAGLRELMNINTISYQYNGLSGNETNGTYVGFSAQNVKDNIPNSTGITANGYLTLQDRAILATLVNAVQEQQKEIEELKQEINRLKK